MNSAKPGKERTRRVPSNSIFYDKIFPIILVLLSIVTAALILVAAGVLLGIIQYR